MVAFKCRPGVTVIYKQEHGREIFKEESELFNSIPIIQADTPWYIEGLGFFFSFLSYCWILLNTSPHTYLAQLLPGCISVVMVGTLHISAEGQLRAGMEFSYLLWLRDYSTVSKIKWLCCIWRYCLRLENSLQCKIQGKSVSPMLTWEVGTSCRYLTGWL